VRRFVAPVGLLAIVILVGCYGGSRPPRIGNPAPDFTVQDAERKFTLSQYRGQVVVLNFWATWCPPCVEETPSLVQMNERLKSKGITLVGVSVDVDDDAYHRFIKAHKIDYLTVRDVNQKSNNLYGTFKFPETYVIRDGKVVAKYISSRDWTSPDIVNEIRGLL